MKKLIATLMTAVFVCACDASDSSSANSEVTTPEKPQSEKTLVVYYSATGTTKSVAEKIAAQTNADIFEVEPATPYTSEDLDYNDPDSRVYKAHEDESLQEEKLAVETPENWGSYTTVYIGYPIWWGIAAHPMKSFVMHNDFTGKKVITFATAASSPIGNSTERLEEVAKGGTWVKGKRFYSGTSDDEVKEWLEEVNK